MYQLSSPQPTRTQLQCRQGNASKCRVPVQTSRASADAATPATSRDAGGHGASGPCMVKVSICTARTCRRQGSQQILKFSEDLQLEGVQVRGVGCMAGCGDGPNVAMDPPGVILNHMATPARFREALQAVGGVTIPPEVLKATELRLAGNAEARGGDLTAAVARYTEALALGIPTGKHLLYANRAGARLTLGDKQGAVQDANAAAECGPPSFTTAYVRQVEAYAGLEQYVEASTALAAAGERFPAFVRSDEYISMRRQLDKLLR